MMKKISLQEYASLEGVSLVTVSKRVNKGLVKSEKVGNRRYILIDDDININENIKAVNKVNDNELLKYLQGDNKRLTKINKLLNKDIEKRNKEIARLNKLVNHEKDNTSNIYLRYINQLENNQIAHKKDDSIEDIEIVKTKRKKAKSKKKK